MITSARIAANELQADGRRYITEIQTDSSGAELRFVYVLPINGDASAIMAARTDAINADLAEVPTVTITQDDGTTATIRTYDVSNLSLQLTAGQKSALVTARNVISAVKPFLRLYQQLTPAQQQYVLNHSPWVAQALELLYGG